MTQVADHTGNIVKASEEVIGISVKNLAKEELGKIYDIMLDKVSGRVVYAVLESGGFLGLGGKLFALPWNTLHYDPQQACFLLDVDKERLKAAPGFDKNHWPNMADKRFSETINEYYSEKSYLE